MNKIRMAIASLFAAMLLVMSGVSAQAATDNLGCHSYGGRVYNDPSSRLLPRIYADGPGTGCPCYYYLGKGQWSNNYYNFRDVDAFYVGPGYRCISPWGYIYYGNVNGTWFWLVNDSVVLSLYCTAVPGGSSPAGDGPTGGEVANGDESEALPGITPPGA
jgi:hypothetical protein